MQSYGGIVIVPPRYDRLYHVSLVVEGSRIVHVACPSFALMRHIICPFSCVFWGKYLAYRACYRVVVYGFVIYFVYSRIALFFCWRIFELSTVSVHFKFDFFRYVMVTKKESFIPLVCVFFALFTVGRTAYASAVADDASCFPILSEYRGHLGHLHTDFESIFLARRIKLIQSFGGSFGSAIHSTEGVSELSQATVKAIGAKHGNASLESSKENTLNAYDVYSPLVITYKNAIRLPSRSGLLWYLQLHLALAYELEEDDKDSPRVFDDLVSRRLKNDELVYSKWQLHQLLSRLDWCTEFLRVTLLLGYGSHSIFSQAKPVLSFVGSYSWKASELATCRLAMEVGSPMMLHPYHIYVGNVPCGYTRRQGYGTIPLSLFFANALGVSWNDKLYVNFKSLYRVLSLWPSACGIRVDGGIVQTGRLAHGFGLILDASVRAIEDVLTLSGGLAYTSGVVDHMHLVSLLYRYRYLSGYRLCSLYLKDGEVKNTDAVSLMGTLTYNMTSWLIMDIKGYYDHFLDGMIGGVESSVRDLFGVDWDLSFRLWKYLTFDIGYLAPYAYLAKGAKLKLPSMFSLGLCFGYCGKRLVSK